MWMIQRSTKDGSIRYAYYEKYIDCYSGKEKRVSVTLNSCTKPAQKQALLLLQKKIAQANSKKDVSISFKDAAYEFLEYKSQFVKTSTINQNYNVLKLLLQLMPSDILLNRITVSIAQDAINKVYFEENHSFGYSKKFLLLMKQIFKYAKRMRYIHDIYFLDDVELLQKPKSIEDIKKERNKFLDRPELKSVLQQLNIINSRISLAMEFVSLTGLRFGELVALRICDYDIHSNQIDVNGSITNFRKNSDNDQRDTPKNIYSVRKVLLNDSATKIINQFIYENRVESLKSTKYCRDGYIFCTNKGYPLNLQFVNRILRKVVIPDKKISSHIFRHTHISLLAELGVPLKAIMERVGHNDPRTTLSVYTHVSENTKREVVEKLNQLAL